MVIGVFITLMLLCQTTAAALMCVVRALPTPAVATTAPAPCPLPPATRKRNLPTTKRPRTVVARIDVRRATPHLRR